MIDKYRATNPTFQQIYNFWFYSFVSQEGYKDFATAVDIHRLNLQPSTTNTKIIVPIKIKSINDLLLMNLSLFNNFLK